MIKIKPVLALVIFFPSLMMAQQHLVDSLIGELKHEMPDSNRAISMMRLAIDYEVVDTAKAYKAYRNAIAFASEKKLYYQLGRIFHNQSVLYSVSGNYTATLESLNKAVMYYRKSKHSRAKKFEANAYGDIANALKNQNNLEQSAEFHLKSIAMFENLGIETEVVTRYCNLATLFGDIREFKKQNEYAHKALAAAKKSNSGIYLHMAYFILSHAYSLQQENNLAKLYIDSARLYFNHSTNVDMIFSYYIISAQVYRNLNQLDSAFYYFKQSFEASEKFNYSYGKAESQLQMGAIAILQKKYTLAEKYLIPGIKEAEIVHNFNILDEGYKYLSDIYAVTGRYELAYKYFQRYKEVNDSLVNLESKNYVNDLEKKYETEKKESLIHHLEVEKQLQELSLQKKSVAIILLICSLGAVFTILYLYYRNVSHKQAIQKQRISELETEKKLEATEAVLKGEEQERSRLAKELHDGLGGLLSGIKYSFNTMKENLIMTPENHQAFERSMDMLDSSIKEMRRVAHNMMPEALVRFGLDTALKDFCNDVSKSGALKVSYQSFGVEGIFIDQIVSITIYRIVQELLNNTIKHSGAAAAVVQVTKSNNLLTVTVEDNGKGFDTNTLIDSKGMGWLNIRNRVEFLKGKLSVNSNAGEGTSVLLEFNI